MDTHSSKHCSPALTPFVMTVLVLAFVFTPLSAGAQSPTPIRIGVLTDESGPYADSAGPGSVLAARMAIDDFGGRALGRPVTLVHSDTLNKPDVASAIARKWYEKDGVSMIVDLPVTPVAIAVQNLATQMNKTVMITAAAASELSTKTGSPVSTHWADDTHALAAGTASIIAARGPASWYFITVDISFGIALQRDASKVIEDKRGKVLGAVRHPTNNADFTSNLLQAKASGARYIGLASVGGDLVTLVKQASEFGIGQDVSQSLVGFLVFINDVHALGLATAQGLVVTTGFYWDQNDDARAFSKRFYETRKVMPSKNQASVYQAVTQYLRAVTLASTDEAQAVNAKLRSQPFSYFGKQASVRSDGRVLYDVDVYRVKKPQESKYAWDYYDSLGTIPHASAFLPLQAPVTRP